MDIGKLFIKCLPKKQASRFMKMTIKTILFIFLFFPKLQAQDNDTLIDVGTHRIHFKIWKGTGIPILFESGGGNDGTVWSHIIEELHQTTGTTIITYDRAGYGQSGFNKSVPENKRGLVSQGASDLVNGLKKLNYFDHLMLVVHSYGGFYANYMSSKYPEIVKGIVLIDANLPCFWNEEFMAEVQKERTEVWLQDIKSKSEAVYYECIAMPENVKIMRTMSIPSAIPVIDILAENSTVSKMTDEKRRIDCHLQFVNQSDNRELINAFETGHYVFFDNPTLVKNAIVKMYTKVSGIIDLGDILLKSLDNNIQNSNTNLKRELSYWHSEEETNNWGYQLINSEDLNIALKVFELNTLLFPDAFNVWDSYGEILLLMGNKVESKKMYQKSLELNPDNEGAQEILKTIEN